MPEQIYKFDPSVNRLLPFGRDQVWFTSDTHFGHENIIRYCGRPFRNAEEMNAELIRRWRETVPEDGIIFHLGDFAHGGSKLWNDILHALTGRKYLILGNHDMAVVAYTPLVDDLCNRKATQNEVEWMLDWLLMYAGNDRMLELYKRVCRKYWQIYPESIAFYIMEYRKEYDPESLIGTEYEYLLHENRFDEEL